MATMTTEAVFAALDLEMTWDYVTRMSQSAMTKMSYCTHDQEVAEVMTEAQEDYFPGCRMVVETFREE